MWRAVGLDPVPVKPLAERTWNATDATSPSPWTTSPGLRERLRALYAPEVAALARDWGIDAALWGRG